MPRKLDELQVQKLPGKISSIFCLNSNVCVYVLRIFLFFLAELPFGWEKVEDPHYGTYYIE